MAVIKREKAINKWLMTAYEASVLITVNAPKEPWKTTKKSKNE